MNGGVCARRGQSGISQQHEESLGFLLSAVPLLANPLSRIGFGVTLPCGTPH